MLKNYFENNENLISFPFHLLGTSNFQFPAARRFRKLQHLRVFSPSIEFSRIFCGIIETLKITSSCDEFSRTFWLLQTSLFDFFLLVDSFGYVKHLMVLQSSFKISRMISDLVETPIFEFPPQVSFGKLQRLRNLSSSF